MESIGYEFLRAQLGLAAFALVHPARVRPVSRVLDTLEELQVPRLVAPKTDLLVDHLLFALKYEGIDLQILAEDRRRRSDCPVARVADRRVHPQGVLPVGVVFWRRTFRLAGHRWPV